MRNLLAALPVLAILALPADLAAKNNHGNGPKWGGKNHREWRRNTEGWRRGSEHMRRRTEDRRFRQNGHFPHDANGDGIVSPWEWPGNQNSFRRLDRNGDGVLSEADRQLRGNQRYYNWSGNMNHYPGYPPYNNYPRRMRIR